MTTFEGSCISFKSHAQYSMKHRLTDLVPNLPYIVRRDLEVTRIIRNLPLVFVHHHISSILLIHGQLVPKSKNSAQRCSKSRVYFQRVKQLHFRKYDSVWQHDDLDSSGITVLTPCTTFPATKYFRSEVPELRGTPPFDLT